MPDLCDLASAYEAVLLDTTISSIRATQNSEKESLTECIDCGEDIPEQRRKLVQ